MKRARVKRSAWRWKCFGLACARALGHAIFTEADTWEALRTNVLEAVSLHFEDAPARPRLAQMHYVKDPLEAA